MGDYVIIMVEKNAKVKKGLFMEQDHIIKIFPGIIKVDKQLDIGTFDIKKIVVKNMCPGFYYCFVKKTAATGIIKEIEIKHESYLDAPCNIPLKGENALSNNMLILYAPKEEKDANHEEVSKKELRKAIERWGLKKGQVKSFHNKYIISYNKGNTFEYNFRIYLNAKEEIAGVKITVK